MRRVGALVVAIVVAMAHASATAQQVAFTESVTDQGMRIWSFPDNHADHFVVAVLVGVGARDEAPAPAGIAHFLEHVVFAQAGDRPKAASDRELVARGIQWNGYTTHEVTVFHLQCDPDDWQFAIEWLADHVQRPAFAIDDIDAERRIVRAELAGQTAHARAVTFESLLYPRHALGRSVGGDPVGLLEVDQAALQRFHAQYYCAANLAVGFAGRVPRDECERVIRRAFGGLSTGSLAPAGKAVEPRRGDLTQNLAAHSGAASMIVGFHLPATTPRELAMAHLLGGYLEGRFFTEVREQRQLAYAPHVDVTAYRDTCRLDLRVGDVPDRRDLSTVLAIVDALVAELQQVDPSRLEDARASLGGLLEASDPVRLGDAMELAWLLRRRGYSPSELALATSGITAREVAEFAQKRLTGDRRFVVADAPIARPFSPWAALAVLAVLLLLLDSFQSFAKSRAMAASVVRGGRRLVTRRRRRGAVVAFPNKAPPAERPIVPVPGDEIEKSIQRYFEEEERGS